MTDLNWTIYAIKDLVQAVFIFAFIALFLIKRHVKRTNRAVACFLGFIFFSGLYAFLRGLSYLFVNETLHRANYITHIVYLMLAVAWADLMGGERIHPGKMAVLGFLGGLAVLAAWLPGSLRVTQIGHSETLLSFAGWWEFFAGVFNISVNVVLGIFYIRLYRHAPPSPSELKSRLGIGIMLAFMLMIIGFLTGALFQGGLFEVGIVLSTTIEILYLGYWLLLLVRYPQIWYILPFEVHRLTVLHGASGIPVFGHEWTKDAPDEILLAGLLQALQSMSIEVVGLGEMREIRLEKGYLLCHLGRHTTTGIILSGKSRFVSENLQFFSREFEASYREALESGGNKLSAFSSASELVKKYFGEIPTRM